MSEKEQAILRQLYLVPESPTTHDVWLSWIQHGFAACKEEVQTELWSLPVELLEFRASPNAVQDKDLNSRFKYLLNCEKSLITAWQEIRKTPYKMPVVANLLEGLMVLVQTKIKDTLKQGAAQ